MKFVAEIKAERQGILLSVKKYFPLFLVVTPYFFHKSGNSTFTSAGALMYEALQDMGIILWPLLKNAIPKINKLMMIIFLTDRQTERKTHGQT